MRLFGLADCNNFFCSCERVFRPELRNRPIVVLSNNDGCIVARSNESKALGIKMGEPYYKIRQQLEENNVAVFSSHNRLYGDMSRRVMTMLSRYVPSIDIYSVDEAFLNFDGWTDVGALRQHCLRMVRNVERGVGIPISVGIAPTRTLAKVATRFAKRYPGYHRVCIIDTPDKRRKALEATDVGDVWGIGRRLGRKLRDYGVKTAADFTAMNPEWVRRQFSVVALRTWRELRGESCIELDDPPEKQSICTSRSFPDKGLSHLYELEEAVANFTSHCAVKLRRDGLACRALTVFAYTSRFSTESPWDYMHLNTTFPVATACGSHLVEAAVGALRKAWRGDEMFHYKKAGVIVWDIGSDSGIQLSLFDTVDRHKAAALQRAVDEANRDNGPDCVRVAIQGDKRPLRVRTDHRTPGQIRFVTP